MAARDATSPLYRRSKRNFPLDVHRGPPRGGAGPNRVLKARGETRHSPRGGRSKASPSFLEEATRTVQGGGPLDSTRGRTLVQWYGTVPSASSARLHVEVGGHGDEPSVEPPPAQLVPDLHRDEHLIEECLEEPELPNTDEGS